MSIKLVFHLTNYVSEFIKKHADRQCNIYVHDLIAEVYFDTDEVLFNSEYRKI